MKTSIISLLVVALMAFALPALALRKGPDRITFKGATTNAVEFSHDAHKVIAGDCKVCHHYGVGTGNCVSCHGRDSRFPSKKDSFHASCIGCHTRMAVSSANDCTFCHKDAGAGAAPFDGTKGGKDRKKRR